MIDPEPILYVKVADTPDRHARGLMFVKSMPDNEGMLFVFSRQQILPFWGENTFIPLDIAFADADGRIRNIESIAPMSRRAVKSSVPCKFAIEANEGFFDKNRIKIGDKIYRKQDSLKGECLYFSKKRRNVVSGFGKNRIKVAQLFNPDFDDDNDDLREDAYNTDDSDVNNYENLPQLSSEDIFESLEDNIEEEPRTIEPPAEQPPPEAPLELPELEQPEEGEVPQFGNVFEAVEWAKPTYQNGFEGHLMRINYTTKYGTNITRDVEPHGTFHAESTGNEILVTFDRTVDDIRAFILSNVNTFSIADTTFDPKFKV